MKRKRTFSQFSFWTVVLEKTLESPLDWKEIQPGDQSWIFIGRTDAEAETPILQPPHAKNRLIWKDPDAGKYWRQEKGTTEDKCLFLFFFFSTCYFTEEKLSLSSFKPSGYMAQPQKYIWISSNEVDETGANYTEWSKPERKTPIQQYSILMHIYGI